VSATPSELDRVIAALAEGVVIYGPQGEVQQFNQSALDALGVTAGMLRAGKSELEQRLVQPDLSPLPERQWPWVEALATGQPVYRRQVVVRVDHRSERELMVSAIPLLTSTQLVERVVVALLDISRELAVISELRVFERFFELSADLLVVSGEDERVFQLNDAVERTLGWPRAKLLSEGLMSLVHPDDVSLTRRHFADPQAPVEFTNRLKTKRGLYRHIAWRVARTGTPRFGLAFFSRGHDVTERQTELDEINRSREILSEAFELAELAVIERNPSTGTTTATPRLRELLQLPDDGPTSIRLEEYVLPDDRARYDAYREQVALVGALPPHVVRLKTARGEIREVRKWVRLARDERGLTRDLTVMQDVTQQSLLQAQLRLAERLASLGTMAAGVAHEINNPLAFVLANLNVVKSELAKLPESPVVDVVDLREAVAEALDGAERVRQIVLSLKPFARVDEHQRGHCDVARIVQAALNMAKNELRHRSRIVSDLRAVGPVFANEARLGQVFLNLLVNAAHAMSEARAAENVVTVVTREDQGQVVVSIQDTGTGIAPDVLPRIFDPFFSTKQIGQGTGLGLFISQGIVKDAGGTVSVNSTPGVGTTFEVRLPVATTTSLSASTTPLPARKRARILLIDDEPSILRALERLLSPAHDLTLAQSGREALTLLNHGLEYDLIICDLMMPEVSGIDVWEQMPAVHRHTTIFMTGGTFTPRAEHFLAQVNPTVLEKPFTATTLEGLLERVQVR
jgi:PAS domain S-box-containing protein